MPIALSDVHVAEIDLKGRYVASVSNTQEIHNIFHFRRTSVSVDPNKENIAIAFAATLFGTGSAHLDDLTSDKVTYDSVKVRYPEDATDPYRESVTSFPVPGTVVTDPLPPQCPVTMLLKTALRGKSYRGRKLFCGIPEADTTVDGLTAGKYTSWKAIAAAIQDGFIDADGNVWVPCVLSRVLSQLNTNPTTAVYNDVVEILVNQTIGSMNSRKVKGVRS
jgi:hypothetical protein